MGRAASRLALAAPCYAPAAEVWPCKVKLADDDFDAVARHCSAVTSEWVPLVDCVGCFRSVPGEPDSLRGQLVCQVGAEGEWVRPCTVETTGSVDLLAGRCVVHAVLRWCSVNGSGVVVVPLQVVEPIVLVPVVRHVVIGRGDDSVSGAAEDGGSPLVRIVLAAFVCLLRCHRIRSVVCGEWVGCHHERLAPIVLAWSAIRSLALLPSVVATLVSSER